MEEGARQQILPQIDSEAGQMLDEIADLPLPVSRTRSSYSELGRGEEVGWIY